MRASTIYDFNDSSLKVLEKITIKREGEDVVFLPVKDIRLFELLKKWWNLRLANNIAYQFRDWQTLECIEEEMDKLGEEIDKLWSE